MQKENSMSFNLETVFESRFDDLMRENEILRRQNEMLKNKLNQITEQCPCLNHSSLCTII